MARPVLRKRKLRRMQTQTRNLLSCVEVDEHGQFQTFVDDATDETKEHELIPLLPDLQDKFNAILPSNAEQHPTEKVIDTIKTVKSPAVVKGAVSSSTAIFGAYVTLTDIVAGVATISLSAIFTVGMLSLSVGLITGGILYYRARRQEQQLRAEYLHKLTQSLIKQRELERVKQERHDAYKQLIDRFDRFYKIKNTTHEDIVAHHLQQQAEMDVSLDMTERLANELFISTTAVSVREHKTFHRQLNAVSDFVEQFSNANFFNENEHAELLRVSGLNTRFKKRRKGHQYEMEVQQSRQFFSLQTPQSAYRKLRKLIFNNTKVTPAVTFLLMSMTLIGTYWALASIPALGIFSIATLVSPFAAGFIAACVGLGVGMRIYKSIRCKDQINKEIKNVQQDIHKLNRQITLEERKKALFAQTDIALNEIMINHLMENNSQLHIQHDHDQHVIEDYEQRLNSYAHEKLEPLLQPAEDTVALDGLFANNIFSRPKLTRTDGALPRADTFSSFTMDIN